MTWAGSWVSERLAVRLRDGERPVGVGLTDLVGLAIRRNPRRAHLLVSTVLGKHIPTDPRLVYAAGLLLGHLVRANLGADAGLSPRRTPSSGAGVVPRGVDVGLLLCGALEGDGGAAARLRDVLRAPCEPVQALVIGYAETATALGHSVADALGGADYLHSTRRPVEGVEPYGGFEEEHSHATSHLLLPADLALLERDGPVVLVDDEMSTGTTALNTIRALQAVRPRKHYVLAALIDLRGPEDRALMAQAAAELGIRIDAVALATGAVDLPPDILRAGQALVESWRVPQPQAVPVRDTPRLDVALGWPVGLPDGGRHGFLPEHREWLEKELPAMARRVAGALPQGVRRVLVLGFEELMYAPLRLGEALADLLPEVQVRYSTTTRSPVLAVDAPGYAIRTRLVFPAHDDPVDGPGERYAYNVAGGDFEAIVVVIDDVAETRLFEEGLLARLREVAPVVVATVPSYAPVQEDAR